MSSSIHRPVCFEGKYTSYDDIKEEYARLGMRVYRELPGLSAEHWEVVAPTAKA